MSRAWVVDASVAVKIFIAEEFSDVAQKLFQDAGRRRGWRLFIPDLFYSECTNIFWKHVRYLGYPVAQARESLDDLRGLDLIQLPVTSLMQDSLELALEHEISAYDASYVALARAFSLPFITADRKLVRKLEGRDTEIHWLGDLAF